MCLRVFCFAFAAKIVFVLVADAMVVVFVFVVVFVAVGGAGGASGAASDAAAAAAGGVAAGGGGGALEFISKTTLSSTTSVEYTGLTAGDTYFLTINDLIRSSTSAYFQSQFLDGNDAAITDSNYGTKVAHNGSVSLTKNQSDRMWNMYTSYTNNSVFGYAYITVNSDRGSFITHYVRTNFNGSDHGYGTEAAFSSCYAAFATSPTGGITGVKIFPSTGNFTSGTFNFYKVKDA